jgi:hypothetical protein
MPTNGAKLGVSWLSMMSRSLQRCWRRGGGGRMEEL